MVALAAVLWLRVYAGPEGQRVEVAKLADATLVRFTKTGSPFDGLVLRADAEHGTVFHGRPWTLLTVASSGKGTAWVPEVRAFPISFLEDGSAGTEALLAEHAKQTEDGRLALFAKKDYPHLTKKYEAKAAAALAELKKTCPAVASLRIAWATFSDDDMANHDVWALCAPVASCVAGVTELSCRRGTKRALVRKDARLTLEVAP